MAINNYWNCRKCEKYVPLFHKEAMSFYTKHIFCTYQAPWDVYLNTTKVEIVGRPYLSALVPGSVPIEGYTCDLELSPMEELAWSFGTDS